MKYLKLLAKIITMILFLFPLVVSAAYSNQAIIVGGGGNFIKATSSQPLYVGSITATTSSASQFPYASTTAISSVTSTTTNLFGAGLIDCNGSNQLLQWTAGIFTCSQFFVVPTSPGGSPNQVQFNDASSFGGNAKFNFTKSNGFIGMGTSTFYSRLTVWGAGTGSNVLANFVNNASTSLMTVLDNGNIGVGSTSPFAKFSIAGIGSFDDFARASYLISTSTPSCSSLSTDSNGKINCSTSISGISTSTASLRNQTATVSSVNTLSPTASSTYSIMVSTDVKVISAGTLTITCTYTNTNGTASVATFFPMGLTSAGLTGAGSPSFTPLTITPMKNTAVTVIATFTGVSITYDIDASILPVGSAVN